MEESSEGIFIKRETEEGIFIKQETEVGSKTSQIAGNDRISSEENNAVDIECSKTSCLDGNTTKQECEEEDRLNIEVNLDLSLNKIDDKENVLSSNIMVSNMEDEQEKVQEKLEMQLDVISKKADDSENRKTCNEVLSNIEDAKTRNYMVSNMRDENITKLQEIISPDSKLFACPIVYTTPLEDMTIFCENLRHWQPNQFYAHIAHESMPIFKNKNITKHHVSKSEELKRILYDNMIIKLQSFNTKETENILEPPSKTEKDTGNEDNQQLCNKLHAISKELTDLNFTKQHERLGLCKPFKIVVQDIFKNTSGHISNRKRKKDHKEQSKSVIGAKTAKSSFQCDSQKEIIDLCDEDDDCIITTESENTTNSTSSSSEYKNFIFYDYYTKQVEVHCFDSNYYRKKFMCFGLSQRDILPRNTIPSSETPEKEPGPNEIGTMNEFHYWYKNEKGKKHEFQFNCWYERENIIQRWRGRLPWHTLRLFKIPHECSYDQCKCCCKNRVQNEENNKNAHQKPTREYVNNENDAVEQPIKNVDCVPKSLCQTVNADIGIINKALQFDKRDKFKVQRRHKNQYKPTGIEEQIRFTDKNGFVEIFEKDSFGHIVQHIKSHDHYSTNTNIISGFDKIPLARYVVDICCWYKRLHQLKTCGLPVSMTSAKHVCLPESCTCCCKPRKDKLKLKSISLLTGINNPKDFRQLEIWQKEKRNKTKVKTHEVRPQNKSNAAKFLSIAPPPSHSNIVPGPSNGPNRPLSTISTNLPVTGGPINCSAVESDTVSGFYISRTQQNQTSNVSPIVTGSSSKVQDTSDTVEDIVSQKLVQTAVFTILDAFKDLRLAVGQAGKVSAELSKPISSLNTAELKILANILTEAQQQVKILGLKPGTTMVPFTTDVPALTPISKEIKLNPQLAIPTPQLATPTVQIAKSKPQDVISTSDSTIRIEENDKNPQNLQSILAVSSGLLMDKILRYRYSYNNLINSITEGSSQNEQQSKAPSKQTKKRKKQTKDVQTQAKIRVVSPTKLNTKFGIAKSTNSKKPNTALEMQKSEYVSQSEERSLNTLASFSRATNVANSTTGGILRPSDPTEIRSTPVAIVNPMITILPIYVSPQTEMSSRTISKPDSQNLMKLPVDQSLPNVPVFQPIEEMATTIPSTPDGSDCFFIVQHDLVKQISNLPGATSQRVLNLPRFPGQQVPSTPGFTGHGDSQMLRPRFLESVVNTTPTSTLRDQDKSGDHTEMNKTSDFIESRDNDYESFEKAFMAEQIKEENLEADDNYEVIIKDEIDIEDEKLFCPSDVII